MPCPKCGEPLDGTSLNGLCPRCVAMNFLASDLPAEPLDETEGPRAGGVPMGDYEIFEELARGGMGVVYRARQVSLDRPVAVKMILSGVLAGDETIARFKTEAGAAAGLRHPHIVAIYEIGEADGMHFFSMEYVAGKSLAALVRDGPLPAPRAAELVEKIAFAVAYAHERGVLHRDLKPSNVLVDEDGEPRVTDFGLAKKIGGGTDLTLSGQILGTPGYLAPEQARGQSAKVGPPADVYGVGAILYHLLTGRAPFVGEDPLAVLRQVENAEPPSLRLLNPTVPRELEAVTMKCLAREPERRYAGAGEVADEMRRWLEGRPVLAKPAGRIEKTSRWVRRNPGTAAAASAIFFLLATVAIISTVAARRLEKSRNAEAAGRKELRRTLYSTGLRVAQQLHDEGAVGSLTQWLDAQAPPPGEEDLRTFEWRLLRHWARGAQESSLQLAVAQGGGAFSSCGRFLTGSTGEDTVLHDLRSGLDAGKWVEPDRPPGFTRHVTANADASFIVYTSGYGVTLWSMAAREGRRLADWPAQAAAFSPDGRLVAVTKFDTSPKPDARGMVFFDAQTWTETSAVAGRFSGLRWQGESVVALEVGTGELQTWTPGAAEPSHRVKLAGWAGQFVTPWFSGDGRRVAVVRPGAAMVVHDAATGALIAEIRGAFPILTTVALSPDGRRLALSGDESIQTFEVDAARPLKRLLGHRARVQSLRFADAGRLLSWAGDGTLRTWQLDAVEDRLIVATQTRLAALKPPVVSPDGRWIALCDVASESADGPAHCVIWDFVARKKIAEAPVLPMAATAQGRELAGLHSGRVIAWHDAVTGERKREVTLPDRVKFNLPRLSPDGRFVAYWTETARGYIHDLAAGAPWLEMVHGTMDAQFSPDGKSVGLVTGSVGLRVIDLATKAERPPVLALASKLAWSPDSQHIAIIQRTTPPVLAIVDAATMQVVSTLEGQGATNSFFAFSHDGQTLATASVDGVLRFWHLPTRSRTLTIPPEGELRSFAFTRRDEAFVIGRAGGFTLLEAPHTVAVPIDLGAQAEEAIAKVLRALYLTCRAHEKQHGNLPGSLDAVRAAWPADVPADTVPWSSFWYAYEVEPGIVPPEPAFEWKESEPPTRRQITESAFAREGSRLPMLRCFARRLQAGRVLNIDHDGEVFVSSADWREIIPVSPARSGVSSRP